MERIFRKLFFILISLVFCAQVFAQDIYAPYIPQEKEVVFNQSTYPISVIDPQASTNVSGANYPGLRGANQLVIYTPAFGFRTNTNEFGTEAIVTGDTVSSLSGADSLIPANGFVISGHGKAKKWINENIMVGAKISIDLENNIITSYITSDTFLYGAKEKVKDVENMMFFYTQNNSYNQRKTEQNLNKAKDYIYKAQRDSEDCQKYASKAIEYADLAMSTVIPYNQHEFKGVWIRPTYYSHEAITSVLDRIAETGINNIFIETYYHGQTIFPSLTMEEYGFIKQNPEYAGFDPLKIWITEAHRRGIKVHIWFETFYVGNKPPETNPKYILAVKPEWANYQKRNVDSKSIPYSVSEHNGYFLDPANADVQAFLYNLIDEIVMRYHPDGINLDYIRYPQSLAPNYSNYEMSNWGYTKFARMEFQRMYHVDPYDLTTNDAMWYQWKTYRAGKITDFVRRVDRLAKMNNVTTTAVIFPNIQMAYDTKLQDWKTWSMNGYIDGFTPLLLTCDDKTATNLLGNVLRNKAPGTKLYAGLFVTFMNGSNADLIKQIHAARIYAINGIILFDYAHLKDSYTEMLTQSIFKPIIKDVSYKGGRYGRRY